MNLGYNDMSSHQIQAIDVHAHYGTYDRADIHRLRQEFMSADCDTVVRRSLQANTEWTIVSPLKSLMPRGEADAHLGNAQAVDDVARTNGLLQWVVIHPLQERTYNQAVEMLALPKCAGIKIHPEEHIYPIADHGRTFFEFAAEHKALVLTHSGEQNSLPEDFVTLANDFPEVTLILAHLGCGWDFDPTYQVRAIQKSKHGNVYVDTSSAQSIMPDLIEWAVEEIGADRLLYGTDTPLYCSSMQRARIDLADLNDEQKSQILRDNAMRLLEGRVELASV